MPNRSKFEPALAVLMLATASIFGPADALAEESRARVCTNFRTIPVAVTISKLGRRDYNNAQCAYHAPGLVQVGLSVKSQSDRRYVHGVSVSLPLKAAHTYTLGVKERRWDDKGKQRVSYDVVIESIEPLGAGDDLMDDSGK